MSDTRIRTPRVGRDWLDRIGPIVGLAIIRIIAIAWIVKGLRHWAEICGVPIPGIASFEAMAPLERGATIYFAVIDIVAGVGLWLAAVWGGVLWLLAVLSLVIVELLFEEIYGGSPLGIAVAILLVGVVAMAAWLVLRTPRRH